MEREETVMVSGRVPVLLRDRVARRAELERRSFTGQLIWLLERGLAEPAGMPVDDAAEVPIAVGAPSVEPQKRSGAGGQNPDSPPEPSQDGNLNPAPDDSPPADGLIMSALREADRRPFRPDFKKEPERRRGRRDSP